MRRLVAVCLSGVREVRGSSPSPVARLVLGKRWGEHGPPSSWSSGEGRRARWVGQTLPRGAPPSTGGGTGPEPDPQAPRYSASQPASKREVRSRCDHVWAPVKTRDSRPGLPFLLNSSALSAVPSPARLLRKNVFRQSRCAVIFEIKKNAQRRLSSLRSLFFVQ